MIYIFIYLVLLMIAYQYKKDNNIVNIFSVLSAPYFILIIINNFIMSNLGFYTISDAVICMITVGLILYFFGALIVNNNWKNKIDENDNLYRLSRYNIRMMTYVLYIISILGLFKLQTLFRYGAFDAINIDDNEGTMGGGLVGHLLNASYSISPIVFLYWTYRPKQMFYLLPVLLLMIVSFSSLVKYHIIGYLIVLFIFTSIYRNSLLKKLSIIFFICIISVFIFNYAFSFYMKDAEVSPEFYYNHLWKYCAGSLIYDNYIFF